MTHALGRTFSTVNHSCEVNRIISFPIVANHRIKHAKSETISQLGDFKLLSSQLFVWVCMGQHIRFVIIPEGFVWYYSLLHTMCSSYEFQT